ncbi:TPA: hypothetical protein N0F65_008436 [Lagenidium giganteum]|uniref:7-dehydrocholesterol reductase n=1 Tax=Lagenidium giganteum TaxID=4803 RepID=A0AAV2YSV8_9STRA|nr:TPA: hypothetical protein N0F65_008436 [Lagenidium giganteum]
MFARTHTSTSAKQFPPPPHTRLNMWSNMKGESKGLLPGRTTIGPLLLMATTPVVAVLIVHLFVVHGGSIQSFLAAKESLRAIWPTPFDPTAWKLIGAFMGTQLVLMRVVPGKTSYGPITPGGNTPVYKANGFQCFMLSIVLFLTGAYQFQLYNGGIVYDHLPHIISALNVFSFAFCFFLYIKGAFLWQSSSDAGVSGNPVFDFYWGTELYPRVLGWDVKLFTNCRAGMMFWAIGIISYACKQAEIYGSFSDSMLVSVGIQLVYVAKFFWWESGYMRSIDIMHDRAGYYLCWGCLVWVPSVYTSQAMYLVKNPVTLGPVVAPTMFAAGILMVWINYAADRQRMQFRESNGKCKIWGKEPQYIVAKYVTEKGEKKSSLLLACGWWGIARHFHYVPEILAAFFWTLPALFSTILPYFYVIYLVVLLTDRAFRDDARCSHKYAQDWKKYCERVPSLIIPKRNTGGLFEALYAQDLLCKLVQQDAERKDSKNEDAVGIRTTTEPPTVDVAVRDLLGGAQLQQCWGKERHVDTEHTAELQCDGQIGHKHRDHDRRDGRREAAEHLPEGTTTHALGQGVRDNCGHIVAKRDRDQWVDAERVQGWEDDDDHRQDLGPERHERR